MGDKRAISVRLGIDNGRHSPSREPPQGVLVYADAKVNWFFVEGAFVLQSIHRRDHVQLEKDFDLYLKRPDSRGDICLNPLREVTEYGLKKDDELEFRHKTLPITVDIDLYNGEKRSIEVNSGYPVMDVVQGICKKIDIDYGQELSLALAERNKHDTATQYKWLDPHSSLNAQGIKDGNSLLLRKKFFILNDDIEEAICGNQLLCELLYHQIRDMFLSDNFVGLTGIDKDKALAQVSCYLHHIEQKDETISDEHVASKVTPKCRQNDKQFPSKLIMVYYQMKLVGLSEEDAKKKLVELFVQPQSMIMTYYPVKVEEDYHEYVLVCHSSAVTLCTVEDNKLQPVDDKEWRFINIRRANCTSKQKIVSVHALGSRHEFNTHYSTQIASHITGSLELTKQRTERNMQKKHDQTPTATPQPSTPVHVVIPPLKTPSPVRVDEPASADIISDQLEEKAVTPELPPQTKDDDPGDSREDAVEPVRQVSPDPPVQTVTVISPSPEPTGPIVTRVAHVVTGGKQKRPISQEIVVVNDVTPTPNNPPPVVNIPEPPPLPPSIVIEDEKPGLYAVDPPTINVEPGEEKKEPLTPITALSFSPTLYIPEYFGLDFRQVLKDYRLFHIVVMDKDKRTLLLNIKKPVSEVIANACATFTIHNPARQKFWLPKGKKNILQKYGGKPKKRAGKFLRKTQSVPIAPELVLDSGKSLEEQYNFDIKPLILHLHYREPQSETEDVDLDVPDHDEVDMGMEWPLHETMDVRSYRQFYQSWCGAVQGAYPMIKEDAIRLAALLTHIYYGDRTLYKTWPPSDYDVKSFLPEMYWKTLGITGDVEKVYKRLSGKTTQECIIETSEFCSRKTTHQGVFFEVTVPGHDVLFHRKKMYPQLFGINSHGVFSVNKDNGEVLFTHRFSDIFDWKYGENTFKLNFSQWSKDYNAYTYQREEILDVLQLYINMTQSGIISQAPSRPPSANLEDSLSMEYEQEEMERKMNRLELGHGSNSPQFSINISHSPESSPEPGTPPTSPIPEELKTPDSIKDIVMTAV